MWKEVNLFSIIERRNVSYEVRASYNSVKAANAKRAGELAENIIPLFAFWNGQAELTNKLAMFGWSLIGRFATDVF